MIVIPIYRTWSELRLVNTYQGLSIAYVAHIIPLAVWMLTGYMRTIPPDLFEAAAVDGASHRDLFRRIVLPLAYPGLAATAVYVALVGWNEFILALTLTSSRSFRTITVGLYTVLNEENQFQQHIVLALATVMALPVSALFLLLQRYLVQGLTAGATKG
jgi:ABC-type glycerol-3-phosphate transport system permease component